MTNPRKIEFLARLISTIVGVVNSRMLLAGVCVVSTVSRVSFLLVSRFIGVMAAAKPLVVFVLGGPGAGKGTQCANIVRVSLITCTTWGY